MRRSTCRDCGRLCESSARCPNCQARYDARTEAGRKARAARADQNRPSAAQRGYDTKWRRIRAQFLRKFPTCDLCGAPATVADHFPETRRELLARGETSPDKHKYLRPVCASCHGLHGPGNNR